MSNNSIQNMPNIDIQSSLSTIVNNKLSPFTKQPIDNSLNNEKLPKSLPKDNKSPLNLPEMPYLKLTASTLKKSVNIGQSNQLDLTGTTDTVSSHIQHPKFAVKTNDLFSSKLPILGGVVNRSRLEYIII